jgi:photosystem II stability/assembly factor-like uncharacterized protein
LITIASGCCHGLAVKSDGTVWAWGYNAYGQLGNGTTTNSSTAVQVSGISGATAVAGGLYHSLALKSNGSSLAWGDNAAGQLGNGTTTNSSTPVQVSGLMGITGIASGSTHTLALTAPGPMVSLSSGFLDFGSQPVGISSPIQVVTLTNTGGSDLHISSIVNGGGGTSDVPLVNPSSTCLGATVPAGGMCAINAYARLTGFGQRSDNIQVYDDAPYSPQVFSGSAVGTDPGPTNGWYLMNSHSNHPFNAISCSSAQSCMAAGGDGFGTVIVATQDGGATWSTVLTQTGNPFYGLSCATSSNCWAVTGLNQVLITSNAGASWTWATASLPNIYAIACPSTSICIAAGTDSSTGRGIAVSGDGGQTWTTASPVLPNAAFAVSCADSTHCLVPSGSAVFTTADGGQTWASHPTAPFKGSNSVSCPTTLVCFNADGYGTVYRTADGGDTWSLSYSYGSNVNGYISCGSASNCVYGTGMNATATVDSGSTWTRVSTGYNGGFLSVSCTTGGVCYGAGNWGALLRNSAPSNAHPLLLSAVSTSSYSLPSSDGVAWQEIDGAKLRLTTSPSSNQSVALRANADLWTDTSGYNQDLGIFVSDKGGADQLLAWKESGGFAGTFSPNAAYVQTLYNMTGGHNYVFKLKWKTNKNAPGATIYSGAGPISGQFSPTSLLVEGFPAGATPYFAVKTNYSSLAGSDGATWQPIDATLTSGTLSPGANSTELLGANADLWTDTTGYNQDLGIFVSVDGGADTLVAWKESGGFGGTFSPNAAYVKAVYPMTTGHTYNFKLKWKTNKNAPGATIYAGAGPISGAWSPTSLLAETIAAGANPYTAVRTNFASLANSDGATWQPLDPALNLTVPGAYNTNAHVGANADMWTDTSGYNQDLAIFVSDNGGADMLVAWKESGGFGGTFSPNAAFVQYSFPMAAGHTYVFKLKWKTNKNAPGATIYAGAGPISGQWSPTRIVAELTN